MIIRVGRQLLLCVFIAVCTAPCLLGQGGAGGKSNRKPSKPQPDYPILHIQKWQVNYRFTASDKNVHKLGNSQIIHEPNWSINGTAIVDSNGSDGTLIPIDPHAESNEWQGRGNGGGSFTGELYGEPSLGYRQVYAGGGNVSPSDHSRVTFKIDAAAGQYEISFFMELYGNVAMDASDLKQKVNAIKSQAKSDDVIGKELLEFLEGIGNYAEKEGTKKFRQTISGDSFKLPLPSSAQGGSPVLSGTKKVQNDVHAVILGMLEGNFSWEIRPYDESKNVSVTLDGCSEVGVGQQGAVTAKGQPAGGSYRFYAEPSDAIRVAGQGAKATVIGAGPGKGTLYVEYTSPEGKTGNASRPAASILVESINGGEPIPKIGLYDVEGKRTDATITVPVSVKPGDAADSIIYKPANPAALTAVSQGDTILLQGVREGKTTLQGTTKCSGGTGPVVSVEIVRCDDEVLAKLAEEERITEEALKEQFKEDGRIRNSKELSEMDIGKSTADLLIKTGGLIIGTLSAQGGTGEAVKTAADIYGAGSNVRDALLGGNPLTAAGQTLLQGLKSAIPGLISDTMEAYEAAQKFGEDLGVLEGSAEQLENVRNWIDHWSRRIEDINRRKKICKPQAERPPKADEPPQEPKPSDKKDPQPPKDPKPTEETPPVTSEPPTDGDPGSDGGELPGEPPSPPPPTTARGPVGLPYDENESCGCGQSAGTGMTPGFAATAEAIGQIGRGFGVLKQCSDRFTNGPLFQYQQTLSEWEIVLGEVDAAVNAGEAERKAAASKLDSLLGATKEFDDEGRKYQTGFDACPAAVSDAVGILKTPPESSAGK